MEAEARKGNVCYTSTLCCTPLLILCLQLKKVTVPVLKAYLKGVGLGAGGKKQELIDAVNQHLGL